MKLYNFARLIRKYSTTFCFYVQNGGHYESGKWVTGESAKYEATGAIIPMSESRIRESGGAYTSKDRELYMMQPIPDSLRGAQVCYQGCTYSVEAETDYRDYADVYVYVLKWVSLFDKEAGLHD